MDDTSSKSEVPMVGEPPVPTSTKSEVEVEVPEGELIQRPVDKTVISQQPIASPEDFFQSLPILEMARLLVGKQLDHFVLDEMVGGGGMGAVFRGRDLRLDRVVAIKVIPSAKRDAETIRRFRVEAQSAAKLDHPNIARVYYVGEADQWSYIVFEFIEGVNLRELVALRGPLSVDDAVFYIRQVAEALEHARSRDVVHRDIKPSNILITSTGQAKLVDMGLARSNEREKSSHDVTASGVTLGTFDYISPEQARDPRDADVRSDLYSLGCTFYYLLVARPPFPDGTALQKLLKHGSERPEDPSFLRGDLSSDLVAILFKLMAKKPSDRYQLPLDLVADLQLLADIEDLPRSQQPGSMIVPMVVTSRTIYESTIPWLLAFSILVLSTFWLQSMDRWQGDYPLPMIDVSRFANKMEDQGISNSSSPSSFPSKNESASLGTKSAAENDSKTSSFSTEATKNSNNIENAAGTVRTADRSDKGTSSLSRHIYVRPSNSTQLISDGSLAVSSLEEAIQIAESNATIDEIWIATPKLSCGSIKVNREGLSIRSAPGFQPRLEWTIHSPTTSENPNDKPIVWFDIGTHQLAVRGLSLEAAIPGDRWHWSIFRAEPSAKLEISDCSMTLENFAGSSGNSMILGDASNRRIFDPIEAFTAPTPSPPLAPLQIRIENSIFRGEAKWLWMPDAFRTEIRWSNGLLAIEDRMLDIGGSTVPSKTPVNVRMNLENLTLACNSALARVTFDGLHSNRVCISRDSRDCAYWIPRGDALTDFVGVDEVQHIEEMLDLRGEDNAYDDGIETIVRVTTREGQVHRFRFDEAPMDVFRERGIESSIRWTESLPPSVPFHLQRPTDYRQRSGDFLSGMIESQLPGL